MPLLNVTGLTYLGSVFNVAFGLIYTERRKGYDWLVAQYKDLQQRLDIKEADTFITDCEDNLKKALDGHFPNV